jgi:hypothetical protein
MANFANAQDKAKTSKSSSICSDDCESKNKKGELTCKLTTPELTERKATVIASLRKQILTTKELKNGFPYKFTGSDIMVDELAAFVKTERECCDCFIFNLSISSDKSEAWLEITGPKGVKDFVKAELEL